MVLFYLYFSKCFIFEYYLCKLQKKYQIIALCIQHFKYKNNELLSCNKGVCSLVGCKDAIHCVFTVIPSLGNLTRNPSTPSQMSGDTASSAV